MPIKEFITITDGSIYINGCETKGIEDFSIKYDDIDAKEFAENCATIKSYNNSTLTFTYRINKIS